MYANSILMDLIFLKTHLEAPIEKVTVLSNLFYRNFLNDDNRFDIKYPAIKPLPENMDEEEAMLASTVDVRSTEPLPHLEDGEDLDDYRSKLDPS